VLSVQCQFTYRDIRIGLDAPEKEFTHLPARSSSLRADPELAHVVKWRGREVLLTRRGL
jgi:hypothetical protein